MLDGSELVEYVNNSPSCNDLELARGAGYVRTTKTGKVQVLKKSFYNALLAAKGMERPVGRNPGKSARYETAVHKNGVILLGRTYSEAFGLNPGDFLDIVIESDCIKLVPQPFEDKAEDTAKAKAKV